MPNGLAIIAVIGVIALIAVYIFAIRKNKESDIPMERTERATHELYEEEHEAAEKRESND